MLFDRFQRYYPIVKILKNEKKGLKILDVGSGSLGLGEYFSGQYYGLDKIIKKNTPTNMIRVTASAVQIPFRDDYFDYVISIDLIEHIHPKDRKKVISEIIRVTKNKAIIGFPCGERALETDKHTRLIYKDKKHEIPEWLQEHLEIEPPKIEDILKYLNAMNIQYRIQKNENHHIHYLLMRFQTNDLFCKLSDFLLKKIKPLMNMFAECSNFGECYRTIIFIEKYE